MRFLVQINQHGTWRTLARFVSFADACQFEAWKVREGHTVKTVVGGVDGEVAA